MNNLQTYFPNRVYEDFPVDDIKYMEELVRNASDWIEKSSIQMPDVMPAIATIYKEDGTIDYAELDNMLKRQHEAWVEGVLIAGTTGESSFMGHEEHLEYIRRASEIADKYGLKTLVGTWSNSSAEQNELTSGAFDAWADASLLLAPYYIKASDVDIIRHLLEGLNLWPAIIYSIGGRTGCPISSDVLKVLSGHPNFLWVKECDGPEKIQELTMAWIRVWTWNDETSFSDIHRDWASGSISVVCNIDPELTLEIREWRNATKGTIDRLLDLSHLMFLPWQPNPKPVHNTIEMIRRFVNDIQTPATFRLPWWPLQTDQQEYLARWLSKQWINAVPFDDNYNLIR